LKQDENEAPAATDAAVAVEKRKSEGKRKSEDKRKSEERPADKRKSRKSKKKSTINILDPIRLTVTMNQNDINYIKRKSAQVELSEEEEKSSKGSNPYEKTEIISAKRTSLTTSYKKRLSKSNSREELSHLDSPKAESRQVRDEMSSH